jgi:hypothetical protein
VKAIFHINIYLWLYCFLLVINMHTVAILNSYEFLGSPWSCAMCWPNVFCHGNCVTFQEVGCCFFDLVLERLCTSIRSAPALRMHAAVFLWHTLLVPSEVHGVDICRNMGIRLTPLTYSFRYSWSYEVCVWWTAEISRHGAYESLQTCISKMDIWTICELTAISVSLCGCWLQ